MSGWPKAVVRAGLPCAGRRRAYAPAVNEIAKLACELIALPSVNPAFLPLNHPDAGEARVADFLAATAAKAGLDVDVQKVLPGRANVLARLTPSAGKSNSAFCWRRIWTRWRRFRRSQFAPRLQQGPDLWARRLRHQRFRRRHARRR